jgi:hypothetical protein
MHLLLTKKRYKSIPLWMTARSSSFTTKSLEDGDRPWRYVEV